MRACVTTELGESEAVEQARNASYEGVDFVQEVTPAAPYEWDPTGEKSREWVQAVAHETRGEKDALGNVFLPVSEPKRRIVAYDFGMKKNILRLLRRNGFQVEVVPQRRPPPTCSRASPLACFSRMAPAIPPRSATRTRPSARSWARRRSSAYASAIRCSDTRSAAARSN